MYLYVCIGNDTLYETKEETETNECIAECKSGSPQFLNCREGCAEMTECQGRCKAAYTDDLKQAVCLFKTCLPNGKNKGMIFTFRRQAMT